MRPLVAFACLIGMCFVAGCAEFYSCKIEIVRTDFVPDTEARVSRGVRTVAEQFGLSVFIQDAEMTLYRKPPGVDVPEALRSKRRAEKGEVTIAYVPKEKRIYISQRDSVEESPYTRAVRLGLEDMLKATVGAEGFRVEIGTWYKDPLAFEVVPEKQANQSALPTPV